MLVYGITFLFETAKLMIFMSNVQLYKIKENYIMVGSVIMAFIAFSVLPLLHVEMGDADIYIIGVVSMMITISNIKGEKKVLNIFGAYMFICIFDMIIAGFIMFVAGITIEELCNEQVWGWLSDLISISLLLIISYKIKNKAKSILEHSNVRNRNIIFMIITLISMGIFLAPLQIMGFDNSLVSKQKLIALAASISCISFSVISVKFFIINSEKRQIEEINKINNTLIESRENYYQKMLKKNNEIRRFRHDISNHLYCLGILCKNGEYNELENYIVDITEKTIELNEGIQTGNDLVNAIVMGTIENYNNIEVDWKGNIPSNIKMNSVDLCTVFYNIFDNATYAVNRVNDNRKICVKVSRLNTSIVIIIENPVIKDVIIKDNNVYTDKLDKKNHGIGTKNIKECLKKYEGWINYSCENKLFKSTIVIQNIIN